MYTIPCIYNLKLNSKNDTISEPHDRFDKPYSGTNSTRFNYKCRRPQVLNVCANFRIVLIANSSRPISSFAQLSRSISYNSIRIANYFEKLSHIRMRPPHCLEHYHSTYIHFGCYFSYGKLPSCRSFGLKFAELTRSLQLLQLVRIIRPSVRSSADSDGLFATI